MVRGEAPEEGGLHPPTTVIPFPVDHVVMRTWASLRRRAGSVIRFPLDPSGNRITPKRVQALPIGLKLAYTGFMAVLLPTYWTFYGPTNFLYFCDLALILTLIGIWTESALLVSMCAVGILLPQTLWVADFIASAVGAPIVGMTAYMFKADASLFLRGLSLFHGWLPFLLVFLVWRLGYDQRAWGAWSLLAIVVLVVCFTLMPEPRPDPGFQPVNINYVWGMNDNVAQTLMHPYLWFAALVVGIPLLLCAPTHVVLKRLMPSTLGRSSYRITSAGFAKGVTGFASKTCDARDPEQDEASACRREPA
ncbi:hypothetical protein [Methylobacterium sp. Leaf466]|uniref:hypothetical protein n=1 Tax=Methylobacterium sp. Leaf466 TaxID=1736386 RepID=UPI000B0045B1